MNLVRTTRRLRGCLLALFVIAQTAGVVPLIYDHTLNEYEFAPVTSHQHAHAQPTVAYPDADHHHGILDLHDQCCALHTLAGPLPTILVAAPAERAGAPMALRMAIVLAQKRPILLDRPPKSLPLI